MGQLIMDDMGNDGYREKESYLQNMLIHIIFIKMEITKEKLVGIFFSCKIKIMTTTKC